MKLLAITPGDPDGIGPEILIETLKKKLFLRKCQFVVFGSARPYEKTNTIDLFFQGSLKDWNKKKTAFDLSPSKKIAPRFFCIWV